MEGNEKLLGKGHIDAGRGKQLMLKPQIYCISQFLPIVSDLLEHRVEKDAEVSTGLIVKWAIINFSCLS